MNNPSSLPSTVEGLFLGVQTLVGGVPQRTLVGLPPLLILLDVVTGIASAVRHKQFALERLSDFVGRDLVKYVVCFLLVLCLAILYGPTSPLVLAALVPLGSLSLSVAGSVLSNVKELYGTSDPTLLVAATQAWQGLLSSAAAGGMTPTTQEPPTAMAAPTPATPVPPPPVPFTAPLPRGMTSGHGAQEEDSYTQIVRALGETSLLPIVAPSGVEPSGTAEGRSTPP